MGLRFSLLMRLLICGGFAQSGPAVSSITSATQIEGTSLVHTVTLASAVAVTEALKPFSIGGVTASTPSDYTATPTFSNGVTLVGSTLHIPVGVSSFTITVATSQDSTYEGTETYNISVGGMTNVGNISDDESAPTIASVSSASATEGNPISHSVVVTGVAQAARTFALAFSGAAVGGTDYNATPTFSAGVTLAGGNVTVPAGVTSFTVTVGTINNALTDGGRSYVLAIGGASGTGSINDDEQPSYYLNGSNPVNTTATRAQGLGPTPLTPVGSSLITPAVTASRSTGVAPLAVFFDATATTAAAWTSRPIHDLEYRYDFGDETVSTWQRGAQPGVLLKNVAFGPVAAHVYENAGTFYPAVQVRYGTDVATLSLPSVTVTAADVEWAGTKTVCYSTTSDFTGAPAGCTQVPNVTDIAASYLANKGTGNKRHLMHKDQTFGIASRLDIDVGGPSMLGAFGSGADPIINSNLTGTGVIGLSKSTTPTGVSDWRFQDFKVDCNNQNNAAVFASNGSYSQMLIDRVYMTRCFYGLLMSGSTIDALNASVNFTHAMWDQVYMVDSTVYDLYTSASGPNATFACGSRVAVLGCDINNNANGEHGLRFQYCNRAAFSNNTIQGIASGKVNLTIRGYPYGGGNTLAAGQYSEKVVISDNKLIGGDSVGMVGIGPQNVTYDERGRNMIFERNWLVGAAATQNMMLISQPDITVRNNFVYLPGPTGGFAFGIQPSGVVPVPNRVNIYNNTVYYGGNTSTYWQMVWVSANNDTSPFDQTMPGSVFEVKNNILYAPNRVSGFVSLATNNNGSVATTTQANNTPNIVTSPLFAANPPTALAHFTPGSASYAQGAGAALPVWRDFYGTLTQATPDMGAVVI